MKRLISILFVGLLIIGGCKSQSPKTETSVIEPVSQSIKNAPIVMNKQMFLSLIMDYEKNPQTWIYKGDKPSVIDFYADWCGPCRITGPILDELAKEYAGKINFYKINVDHEQELASVFGVQSIPAMLYIPMKDKPTMSAGIAQTKEETKQMFKQQLDLLLKSTEKIDL